jgi:hypothetical protein
MSGLKYPMSAEDRAWRARSDAETLARAEEIRSDRTRHTAAAGHAKKEAERLMKVGKATGMSRQSKKDPAPGKVKDSKVKDVKPRNPVVPGKTNGAKPRGR